jgi:RHS repeat-associated protein
MGNVTGDGARTYVWSAAGLLKEAKIGGTTVGAYTYSANNQRTKKVAGGTMTHYVYGLGGKLYGEYDNAGVLIREYVWLNGEPLAQVTKSGATETVTYLHTDHLATPRYGTNAAGSTVWTWDSGAFGKEAPTGSATVNLRFPGQYYDSESTLHYNWNRYYNPATGRYVSSDPIGLEGGLNTYLYAFASPLVLIDPEGLEVKFCCATYHCWVETTQYPKGAGYGGNQDTWWPSDATVEDNSAETKGWIMCGTFTDADETCVNDRIERDMGKPMGQWDPAYNQCRNYAWNVIQRCRPWYKEYKEWYKQETGKSID